MDRHRQLSATARTNSSYEQALAIAWRLAEADPADSNCNVT